MLFGLFDPPSLLEGLRNILTAPSSHLLLGLWSVWVFCYRAKLLVCCSRLFCRPFSPRFFLMHLKCNPLSRSPGSIFPRLKRKRASYYQLEVLHFLTGKYKSPLLPTESLQAFFWTFRKKIKQIFEKLKQIIRKLNNLPTKNWLFAQVIFAQKFAQK